MHNQEIDEMCMYTGLPACLLISHSGPLYLGDLFDASCYLSPRWGFGEGVFGVSIHLPPLWGYVT